MNVTRNHILLQAYGNEGIIAECRLALLELEKYNEPGTIKVVLYTDDPGAFEKELDIFDHKEIRLISADEIKAWKGEINFVHRVKIKILQDFFTKHAGNVIYLDTDTVCLQSLSGVFENINNGSLYMHLNEGRVKDKKDIEARKWLRFLKNNDLQKIELDNAEETFMMNAGVIGMNDNHAGLLDKVLAVTDAVYPLFPRHTVEQFAFSYTFQKNGKVLSAEKEIFHYWDLKEYRVFLQEFFKKTYGMLPGQQQRTLTGFSPVMIMEEKLNYKKGFILSKLFKKKWNINGYIDAIKNIKQ